MLISADWSGGVSCACLLQHNRWPKSPWGDNPLLTYGITTSQVFITYTRDPCEPWGILQPFSDCRPSSKVSTTMCHGTITCPALWMSWPMTPLPSEPSLTQHYCLTLIHLHAESYLAALGPSAQDGLLCDLCTSSQEAIQCGVVSGTYNTLPPTGSKGKHSAKCSTSTPCCKMPVKPFPTG